MAFSPDGKTLATLSVVNRVELWDTNELKRISQLIERNLDTTIYGLVFSPDTDVLAVVLWDSIQFWKVSNGVLLDTFEINTAMTFAFSPDWTVLALGGPGGSLELWQLNERTLQFQLQTGQFNSLHSIETVAFSPNGTVLASGSVDGLIRLWRMSDGTQIQEFKGHTAGVKSVAFSPDGTILASGSADNTVRLWRVTDGALLHVLNRPAHLIFDSQINAVAFSPDGALIAGGGTNPVQIWQVSNGNLLHTLPHSRIVWDVTFSPDGKIFATTQTRGPVSLFDVQQWGYNNISQPAP